MQPDYRQLIERDGAGRFERLAALLAQVEQQGSLRRATDALGLSYRYAWGLIRQAEERVGSPLLLRRVGGAAGGGAELTETARELLRRHRLLQEGIAVIMGGPGAPGPVVPAAPTPDRPLLMASTIGPVEAGLVDALVAAYRAATGVWIRYVAAGTGQALALARDGRVDLVLVHAPTHEERFVAEGYGTGRYPLACNSFALCGPLVDPAGVANAPTAPVALCRIAGAGAAFISRGDGSGTHVKEQQLWAAAGIEPNHPWYQPYSLGGQGNAVTLRHAASLGAYTLIDSATLALHPQPAYGPLLTDDPLLANTFTLIPLHPERFPQANHQGAAHFVGWAIGPDGRALVAAFGQADHGRPLFRLPPPNGGL